jgi:hypothetical protein
MIHIPFKFYKQKTYKLNSRVHFHKSMPAKGLRDSVPAEDREKAGGMVPPHLRKAIARLRLPLKI